jgi:hypothetical protein
MINEVINDILNEYILFLWYQANLPFKIDYLHTIFLVT